MKITNYVSKHMKSICQRKQFDLMFNISLLNFKWFFNLIFIQNFRSGYFGLSAATGELSDDHDILKFLTHSLIEPGKFQTPDEIKDRDKYNKEYETYKQKMDQKQEEYLKTHPNEVNKLKHHDPSDEYDTLGEREFQQILSAQGEVHNILRNLNHKLDEILGKQERSLSMMSALQTGSGGYQHPNQQPPMGQLPMSRHEFEALLVQQNELVSNSRQIRQSVLAMGNAAANQPASVQQASQFNQQILTETREGKSLKYWF